jgi:murein DD-endopeptidase MepM/ murein hydrolase activator NlpD
MSKSELSSEPVLPPALSRPLSRMAAAVHRHPGRLAAGALALLGGFAVTAFGVAPLTATSVPVAQQMISQSVAVPGLQQQIEALDQQVLQLHRQTTLRRSDTADALMRRLGVSDGQSARLLRQDERLATLLAASSAGGLVEATADAQGRLQSLVARLPAAEPEQRTHQFRRLTWVQASTDGAAPEVRVETAELERITRLGSGDVRGSIWAAIDEANLPDAIARQLIEIFSDDIDFHRELRRGDSFRVAYEGLLADGRPVAWDEGTGRVLAAEFRNRGRVHQAYWHPGPAGSDDSAGAYLDEHGRGLLNTFLASPLAFSRVTSGFEMRVHPVLRDWRAHNGVDYGAPTGTPVMSVADGVIEFAGQQRGYGQVVEVRHDRRQTTLYAHLSQIGVKAGQKVQRGQSIGAVGATGMATGPHLHFELRVDGQFQDPLVLAEQARSQRSLEAAARPQLRERTEQGRAWLAMAGSVSRFRGDAE